MFVSFDPLKSCVSMCYYWQHNCAFLSLVSNLLMNIFRENQISYMSVSNLFIINHIVRFLTITDVERLKSLKSSFIFLRRILFPKLMPFHCFIKQVLVVANPTNTNALILKEFAPSIPEKNITCLTRLDHNRALSQIAERLKVYVTDVKNVI